MSPAEKVFFAALAKADPAERAAYLNEACGADLRRQVERLLAAHPEVGSFLHDAPIQPSPLARGEPGVGASATVAGPTAERAGTVIGPYKLLQQIGEGGMGTVFMAEQTQPVQRKVALKLIKPGMDSRQVIARFEAERQALAMMDHVNIARVFDGGTTSGEPGGVSPGRPYFVMELVHGVPITKYCDDSHLTPRERLELFVPVCQAIQHAHQKGIIHRDIKPSNVMVTLYDGKPVPKVIDFGVAKATEQKLTERTLFTQYGTMVGTFEYMSPEQAEMSALGVDTRSDIYSLGVLLYELLTGSTPLTRKRMKEAAYAEILRMIKEEEPQKPSTRLSDSGEALASIAAQRKTEPAKLTRLIRGELDWIVMKTLEKDRNRRYETANGLAHDIENFLHDEPVQACPPSAWYRFRKFARRNKVVLGAAALIAGILLVGIAISTWQAIRAGKAENLAEQRLQAEKVASKAEAEQRQLANDEKNRAETNLRKAREAVDKMFTEVAEKLAGQPHMEQIRRRLLEDALEFYQGFLKQKSADPEMRHETARAYLRVGNIHEYLGNDSQAEPAQREAVVLFEKLVADFPTAPAYREDLIASRELLAFRMLWVPKPDECMDLRRRDLADWEKLAADFPGEPRYQRRIARAHTDLANALREPGRRPAEAEHHYRQALTAWKKYQANFPKMSVDRWGLAHSRLWLGVFLLRTGRFEEAEPELREALALRRQLVADDPDNVVWKLDLARAMHHYGDLLRNTAKAHEAMKLFQEAIDIYAKHRDRFPHDATALNWLGDDNAQLSTTFLAMGRTEEAEDARRRCVTFYSRLAADHPGENRYANLVRRNQFHLGLLLFYMKKDQDAADAFRTAMAISEKLAKAHPGDPDHQTYLAFLLVACPAPQFRDAGRAIDLLKRALQQRPLDASDWLLLGAAHSRASNGKDALEATQKSMDLSKGGGVGHWLVLAMTHCQLGDKVEARKWYDKAAAQMKNAPLRDLVEHFAEREAATLLGLKQPPASKDKGEKPEQKIDPR
jgi:serine/threonine protein kinase